MLSMSKRALRKPNFVDKSVFIGDNLDVMRGFNDESFDLIYLDPPFNSNKNHSAPIGSKAAGLAFKDTWTLDDLDLAWHGEIADKYPDPYSIISSARLIHGKGMQSYLIMMSVRLMEIYRVLKPSGTVYLHCNPTAGHYLKLVMDAVFGKNDFRNEIIWSYRRWPAKHSNFQRMHDTIFRYGKSGGLTWNQLYEPLAESTQKTFGKNRQVAVFDKSGHRTPGLTETKSKGAPMRDVWDISVIAPSAKERTGYPTQKPLALLRRIIEASSNPGDIVLDPFCGCATALIAAEDLDRRWVGIDISPKAKDLIETRLVNELGMRSLGLSIRDDAPKRTDIGELPHYKTHSHSLYGQQEGLCNGCREHFPFRNMTVDHKTPQNKGGTDHLDNLQLLCGACNSTKGTGTQAELLSKLKIQKTSR